MNTIIPDEPAFPNDTFDGIPMRLYIAAQIMAGAAGNPNVQTPEREALFALAFADALIAEHNKETK